uniref:LOW QUALITY PROTEIN: forkhead box protein B2 n=1 Tax=Elaeis guineensis var. tenera TaxID=51953 RepID=A0A6I9Q8T4_ELAGV|nr:LOW QUALITY PROTEIN: forkhead box protein B2 [Elaeis guineensis]
MTLCKMQPEIEGMKPQFHPNPHHPFSLPLRPPPPHHHHHHPPLLHFHLPLFLHRPCSCPPLLLIPHHHHHPSCPLPFQPRSSNVSCPNFSPIPPAVPSSQPIQNPCLVPSRAAAVESLEVSEAQTMDSSALELQQQEWREDQDLEDEEDVFVLTDEWMEFFAKSEAKRRLAKQRKKKGGK